MTITISAIAAMSRNRVIGAGNKMPWHLPEDFKHFKRTTMGKPVIMGRKTFESLGKPLPGRTNIVVTRSLPPTPPFPQAGGGGQGGAGVVVLSSLDSAIKTAKEIAARDDVGEIFVCGGGQIYESALPILDRIYLTIIDQDYEGDAFFPDIDLNEWNETVLATHSNPINFMIKKLDRKI